MSGVCFHATQSDTSLPWMKYSRYEIVGLSRTGRSEQTISILITQEAPPDQPRPCRPGRQLCSEARHKNPPSNLRHGKHSLSSTGSSRFPKSHITWRLVGASCRTSDANVYVQQGSFRNGPADKESNGYNRYDVAEKQQPNT